VIAKRHVDQSAFDRTLALMNNSFDGALVENWEPVVMELELPDRTTGTSSPQQSLVVRKRSSRSTSPTSPTTPHRRSPS